MISDRVVIYTYLFFTAFLTALSEDSSVEDLIYQYYTTIPVTRELPKEQDEKDAQAIIDKDRDEKVIASILPFRDKVRRTAINERILTKINAVVRIEHWREWETIRYWINDQYPTQRNGNSTVPFMDLCFGLIADEYVVLGSYLYNFLHLREETWIIIGMILTKDMHAMISTFDKNYIYKFKDQRNAQREPFKNMLRVWVKHNREPIEREELNNESVKKDAEELISEQKNGGWEEHRDKIELILMKKSIKYARAVIQEFEKIMENKLIENIINENVESKGLNHDLADAYASLACYIKDRYGYIAGILQKYSDGSDKWAAWIMCIAVLRPDEWPKVDEAYKRYHKDDSLSKFILQKLTTDKVMAEMIAVILDPKFKPTTFSKKEV